MIRIALALVLFAACSKSTDAKPKAAPPAPVTAGKVGADGLRHVPVEANKEGYTPDKIAGKPGEKLVLVFTRTADSECISQVKVGSAAPVDLPLNKPTDVAITVPQSGQVDFACGMDMFHGVVVAQPAS